MHAVFFAGEWFRQIRIAFPVGVEVSIIQPRIAIELRPAVAGYTPMRQRVSVGMTDRFLCRHRVADEIPITRRIAPPPFRIPMPGLNEPFHILAIGHRAPARFKNMFYLVRSKESVRGVARNTAES